MVPSYQESYDILPLLASVVDQEDVDPAMLAVLIVINNQRGAAMETLISNRQTQQLIEGIWKGEPPLDLLVQSERGEDPRFYYLLNLFRQVARTELNLLLLDAWTPGHAPKKCNVGVARDMGGRVAARFLRDRQPMIFTDADSQLDPGYIAAALKEFADPSVAAATGPVQPLPDDFRPEERVLVEMENIRWVTEDCQQKLLQMVGMAPEPRPRGDVMMPGANLSVREDVFRAVGGMPRLSGGEDITFTLRLHAKHLRVVRNENMKIMTSPRVSVRTHPDHGYGQAQQRRQEQSGDYAEFQVHSLGYQHYVAALREYIETSRAQMTDEQSCILCMKAFVAPHSPRQIGTRESRELWRSIQMAPQITQLCDNDVTRVWTRRMGEKRYPHIPLREAVGQIETVLQDCPFPSVSRAREMLGGIVDSMPTVDPSCPLDEDALLNMRQNWRSRVFSLIPVVESAQHDHDISGLLGVLNDFLQQDGLTEELPYLQREIAEQLPQIRHVLVERAAGLCSARWLLMHAARLAGSDPRNTYALQEAKNLIAMTEDATRMMVELGVWHISCNVAEIDPFADIIDRDLVLGALFEAAGSVEMKIAKILVGIDRLLKNLEERKKV